MDNEIMALGRKLIAWAANESNAITETLSGNGHCWMCDTLGLSRGLVVHKPDCLHVQAKALATSADDGGEG